MTDHCHGRCQAIVQRCWCQHSLWCGWCWCIVPLRQATRKHFWQVYPGGNGSFYFVLTQQLTLCYQVPAKKLICSQNISTFIHASLLLYLLSISLLFFYLVCFQHNSIGSHKTRIGIFDIYAVLLTKLGTSFFESHFLIISHLTRIISNPRTHTGSSRYDKSLVWSLVSILLCYYWWMCIWNGGLRWCLASWLLPLCSTIYWLQACIFRVVMLRNSLGFTSSLEEGLLSLLHAVLIHPSRI